MKPEDEEAQPGFGLHPSPLIHAKQRVSSVQALLAGNKRQKKGYLLFCFLFGLNKGPRESKLCKRQERV